MIEPQRHRDTENSLIPVNGPASTVDSTAPRSGARGRNRTDARTGFSSGRLAHPSDSAAQAGPRRGPAVESIGSVSPCLCG
ncbi:MAG: hypothetical protein DMF93_23695 [Acidobacteria bacterium]|nr:MAG: hypothetical protein DMF93_23695 [Acidobacteriota bacterium]